MTYKNNNHDADNINETYYYSAKQMQIYNQYSLDPINVFVIYCFLDNIGYQFIIYI